MALIICDECGHDVSTKANACPNCGAPPVIESQDEENILSSEEDESHGDNEGPISKNEPSISNEKHEKQPSSIVRIIKYGLLYPFILIIMLVTYEIVMQGNVGDRTSQKSNIRTVNLGDIGTLKFKNDKGVITVPTTKSNLNEYIRLLNLKDLDGLEMMLKTGKLYIVDSGTKVRVIDARYKESGIAKGALLSYEIRIIDNEQYKGRNGWVPYEWVK